MDLQQEKGALALLIVNIKGKEGLEMWKDDFFSCTAPFHYNVLLRILP